MRAAQPNEKEESHGRQSRALVSLHTSYLKLLHHPVQSPFSLRALPSMSLITIRSIHLSAFQYGGQRLPPAIG